MKDTELKDYKRVLCNIGYAISALFGVVVGAVVGILIHALQLNMILSGVICIAAATLVTALCCSYVWLISVHARSMSAPRTEIVPATSNECA